MVRLICHKFDLKIYYVYNNIMDTIIEAIRNTTNYYKNIDGSDKLDDKGDKIPKPPLKESTIKSYTSTFNKVKELIETNDKKEYDFKNLSWLNNVNKVIKIFKNKNLSDSTLKNYYNVIVVVLKAIKSDIKLINRYMFLRDNLNKSYQEEQKTGIISDKQAPNFITKKQYEKYIDDVEKLPPTFINLTLLSILKLYQFLPTRNELAELKIIDKDEFNSMDKDIKTKSNWIVFRKNSAFIVIYNYKNDKVYGTYKEKLPDYLFKLFKRMLEKKQEKFPKADNSLFHNSRGTPMTKNNLSQFLIRSSREYFNNPDFIEIFGSNTPQISTTMIRKIYASDLSAEKNEQQKELASKMKHSVDTQNKIYVKKPQKVAGTKDD